MYHCKRFILASLFFLGACSQPVSLFGTASTNSTEKAIRTLQPALAIRGMGCIMCHAKINANIVTDFGYGNEFFLNESHKDDAGKPIDQDTKGNGGYFLANAWYGNTVRSWQQKTYLKGDIYIPTATVPDNIAKAIGLSKGDDDQKPYTLKELMLEKSLYHVNFYSNVFYKNENVVPFTDPKIDPPEYASIPEEELLNKEYPGLIKLDTTKPKALNFNLLAVFDEPNKPFKELPEDEQPKIIEKKSITIQAPKENEILELLNLNSESSGGNYPVIKQVTLPGATNTATFSGLSEKDGAAGAKYFTNNEDVICKGADVVISGTLYLKNLEINADNGGCRLYVAGSVFIEGEIKYKGSSDTQNLQISSSRIISMGVGEKYLKYRLDESAGRGAFLRDVEFTKLQKEILADAKSIVNQDNENDLVDSCSKVANYTGSCSAVKDDPDDLNETPSDRHTSIDYKHLLLNAPIVFSRYTGKLKAVIISELALFVPSKLEFTFDPVFLKVPVLPQLTTGPLSTE